MCAGIMFSGKFSVGSLLNVYNCYVTDVILYIHIAAFQRKLKFLNSFYKTSTGSLVTKEI